MSIYISKNKLSLYQESYDCQVEIQVAVYLVISLKKSYVLWKYDGRW